MKKQNSKSNNNITDPTVFRNSKTKKNIITKETYVDLLKDTNKLKDVQVAVNKAGINFTLSDKDTKAKSDREFISTLKKRLSLEICELLKNYNQNKSEDNYKLSGIVEVNFNFNIEGKEITTKKIPISDEEYSELTSDYLRLLEKEDLIALIHYVLMVLVRAIEQDILRIVDDKQYFYEG